MPSRESSNTVEYASTSAIGVLIVEPDPIARDVLHRALSVSETLRVTGSTRDSISAEAPRLPVGTSVLVLAIPAPSSTDFRQLNRLAAHARVLVLGTEWTRESLILAFESGVAACMVKNADTSGLTSAIEAIASGHIVMSPELLKIYSAQPRRSDTRRLEAILTAREIEILSMLCAGMTTHEISQQLVVALPTVKSHISHLLAKLGVKNRVQAVLMAKEHGLDVGAHDRMSYPERPIHESPPSARGRRWPSGFPAPGLPG